MCFAQKQYVFLLKNNGDHVHTKDSMDYIRVVKGPIEGTKFYNVGEYYPSGEPKSIGQSSGIDPLALEGNYITYWPGGKIKSTSVYKHNRVSGDISDFFRNSQLHAILTYTPPDSATLNDEPAKLPDIYFKTCNDSTGKALLVNGNGYYIDYDDSGLKITEEGPVKDGKRVGEWKGTGEGGKVTFKETYDDSGQLILGTSTDLNGTYTYKTRFISAQYPGGTKALDYYLARTIRYPGIARENNIQGKVIIGFTVNNSGKLENVEVHQTVSREIDAESLKALKASTGWLPAMAYGRNVSQLFFVPISFSLGYR